MQTGMTGTLRFVFDMDLTSSDFAKSMRIDWYAIEEIKSQKANIKSQKYEPRLIKQASWAILLPFDICLLTFDFSFLNTSVS
jgi:hypothetical protein